MPPHHVEANLFDRSFLEEVSIEATFLSLALSLSSCKVVDVVGIHVLNQGS